MIFLIPKNLTEALELVAKYPGHKILAGGTDICVLMNSGQATPDGLINIWGLDELRGIRVPSPPLPAVALAKAGWGEGVKPRGGHAPLRGQACPEPLDRLGTQQSRRGEGENTLDIGALTTHSEIINSSAVKKYIPALAEACRTIGAKQIQNRGTIGGNVMNASPAGDTLPVLLAYDTEVELSSIKGVRRVPFSKFFTGYRKTVARPDEIVTKFIFPVPFILPLSAKGGSASGGGERVRVRGAERSAFLKIGTRKAQAISKVMGCFRRVVIPAKAGIQRTQFRIAFGSVAPIPVRLTAVENYLAGKKITNEVIKEAVSLAKKEVQPIDDIRSNAEYRRHACGVLLKKFLIQL